MSDKRAAKFYINREMIEETPSLVKDILADVIIVRAEMSYMQNAVEYVGLADFFPIVPQYSEIPEVNIIGMKNEDGDDEYYFDVDKGQ